MCPSCRLDARIKAAQTGRPGISGGVGPSNPPPNPPPNSGNGFWQTPPQGQYAPGTARVTATASPRSTALATIAPETRALVALGYPMWPLALLAMLGSRQSSEVRRQALQALGFNFGCLGLTVGFGAIAHLPFLIGLSAIPLYVLIGPVWLVASIVYAVRVWCGEDVRVPLVTEWLDQREAQAA